MFRGSGFLALRGVGGCLLQGFVGLRRTLLEHTFTSSLNTNHPRTV